MITFGLTGGIACGKSTVTKTFRQYGIPMVDADILAREVVVPGSKGLAQVIECFGPSYLNEDGTLNRIELGKLVFGKQDALNRINSIMLPLIRAEAARQIKIFHSDGHPLVGYDGALICEMGDAKLYHPLIVVSCPVETQIARLMSRNTLTHEEAMGRINAQMSLKDKIAMADFVIDTSGTIEQSISATINIISELRNSML